LPDDFFAQCVAERKVARYVKGKRLVEWTKSKAERNEALDLMVYALGMAEYLGLHRYHENDWEKVRQSLMQHHLFENKSLPPEVTDNDPTQEQGAEPLEAVQGAPVIPVAVAHHVVTSKPVAAAPARRVSRSGYLKRR